MAEKDVLSIQDAAKEVDGYYQAVYRAFVDGRIPGYRKGGRVYLDRAGFNEWKENLLLGRQVKERYRELTNQHKRRTQSEAVTA